MSSQPSNLDAEQDSANPSSPKTKSHPCCRPGSSKAQAALLTLPVYFHWEFRTGTGGDFESLVTRLKARKMPVEVGKRPMDISNPGFEMPDMPPDAGRTNARTRRRFARIEGSLMNGRQSTFYRFKKR